MSILNSIIGFLTGETPEEVERSFQETRDDFFNEPELTQDDIDNYVDQISAHPQREGWSSNGIFYWIEYVTDQRNIRHIINSGSHYVGGSEPEIIYGEPIEIPIQMSELYEEEEVSTGYSDEYAE